MHNLGVANRMSLRIAF